MTDSAFLVLHFQNGVAHPDGVWGKHLFPQVQKNGSIENTKKALGAARGSGMPVIFVNIAWRPGYPELPENTCGLLKEAKEQNECLVGSWGHGGHSRAQADRERNHHLQLWLGRL